MKKEKMSRPCAVKGRPDSPGARQHDRTGRKKGRKEGVVTPSPALPCMLGTMIAPSLPWVLVGLGLGFFFLVFFFLSRLRFSFFI